MSEAVALLHVEHETRYDYTAAVAQAQHLAFLQPLHDGRQQLLEHELTVEPAPAQRSANHDVFGNRREFFCLTQPHRALRVTMRCRVALAAGGAPAANDSPAWEAVRQRLRYEAGAPFDAAVQFVQPSPYVPRLAALREYAQASFEPGRPLLHGAMDLMHRIHVDFRFDSASTEVDTPLVEAFDRRRGVCQDFAHLMIGMLRIQGLAARYVSGYLLTTPAPGSAPMVGADASHAWVQVYCPRGEGDDWLSLDPTNDVVPDRGHVRLAVGRDYGDVAPLRGVIRGGGRHTLQVSVATRRADAGPARMLLI